MTEVWVKKRFGGIEAASDEAFKVLSNIGTGAEFWIDVRDPRRRSTEQHNFWFAMVTTIYESQTCYKKFDAFRGVILIEMGYADEYPLRGGLVYFCPHSLKFGNMAQETFTTLVDDTLTFAEEHGFDRDELLQHTRERAGWAA